MRTVYTWTLVTLAIVFIPAVALAQSQTRPGTDAATYNRHLQIGPVPGLTTAWHPAPTETAAPLGMTLSFKVTSGRGASVEWTGARLMERRHGTSTAECYLATPGPHTVTVEYTDAGGERRQESTRLNVIDTSVFPITFSRPRIWADPVLLDESATNEDTMRYYFGDSIAAVRQLDEGRYLTSTNRWFNLEVDVEPAGFAPLVEWRLNGRAQRHLGTEIQMQVFPAREHTIAVGVAERSKEVSLQTYMVHITSHEPRIDDIPEFSPVTFTAVTDPPGYEDEITWLASTKYGSCDPVMGRGAEFTVSYRNTLGVDGQWLGAKADQAQVGQDQKGDQIGRLTDPARNQLLNILNQKAKAEGVSLDLTSVDILLLPDGVAAGGLIQGYRELTPDDFERGVDIGFVYLGISQEKQIVPAGFYTIFSRATINEPAETGVLILRNSDGEEFEPPVTFAGEPAPPEEFSGEFQWHRWRITDSNINWVHCWKCGDRTLWCGDGTWGINRFVSIP